MARVTYSEDDKKVFIELAQVEGIEPSRKKLGYPGSFNTAKAWLDSAGVVLTVDTLKAKAGEMRAFYGQKEQMYTLQSLLDTIQTKLEHENLSPDAISKLAGATQKVVTTMELVAGRVTNRTESWDGMDRTILDGLARAQEKNERQRATIVQDTYNELVESTELEADVDSDEYTAQTQSYDTEDIVYAEIVED